MAYSWNSDTQCWQRGSLGDLASSFFWLGVWVGPPEVCFRIVFFLGKENTGIQKQKTGRCWQLMFIPKIGEDDLEFEHIF